MSSSTTSTTDKDFPYFFENLWPAFELAQVEFWRKRRYMADTDDAINTPKSAMTVSVNGIPMSAKKMQKIRPDVVAGAMLP